jgi:NAD-dependent SIR2 family protein deacetylase
VKPDIVFFGENLPAKFFDEAEISSLFADLLICVGTSLEVYPFAGTVQVKIIYFVGTGTI